MKKIFFSLLMAFAFFFSNADNAKATDFCSQFQCYDNNNIPWVNHQMTITPYPTADPDCWIRITFRYRLDRTPRLCPSLDPFQIEIIQMLVSGSCYYDNPPNPKIYNFQDNFEVYLDAFDAIVKYLNTLPPSMNLLPPAGIPNACKEYTNQKKQGCSKEVFNGINNEIYPCESEACCLFKIKYCNSQSGTLIPKAQFEFLQFPQPYPTCIPNTDTDCKWSCFNNVNDVLLPKKGENNLEILENEVLYKFSNDLININFQNDLNYDVTVRIISSLGQTVFIETKQFKNNNLNYDINIESLSSGAYYLIITKGNVVYNSYNFIK